jgi:hypothetical protein
VRDARIRKWFASSIRWRWLAIACWIGGSGCATMPYRCSQFRATDDAPLTEVRFEYGRPQKTLDGVAWATGLWSRMLQMNSRVNRHCLCDDAKAKLVGYLEDNDLTDVLVRVNQYDPRGEWRRLRENHRISPGWRYTVGVFSLAHYTLIPGRIFGGDQYNAYTNTLYINSDVSAIALHEAAYAKDIHSRKLPGTYAFVNQFPLLSLWRHTNGVNDVLGYAMSHDDWFVERETYRVVYPQVGARCTAVMGTCVPFWDGILLSVAGAAAGHTTGQFVIARRTRERRLEDEGGSEEHDEAEPSLAKRYINESSVGRIRFTSHEVEDADADEQP